MKSKSICNSIEDFCQQFENQWIYLYPAKDTWRLRPTFQDNNRTWCVYRVHCFESIVYVGQSENIGARLKHHYLTVPCTHFSYIVVPSFSAKITNSDRYVTLNRMVVESYFIEKTNPPLNGKTERAAYNTFKKSGNGFYDIELW